MNDYQLALIDRREIAEGTMAFKFDTTGTDFVFTAGQNSQFTLPLDPAASDGKGNFRIFSIASSPNHKDYLMIATRMRDSAFKNFLKTAPLGTKVKVGKPTGFFTLHNDASRPAVFLIGGVGITPVRSIIEWTVNKKLGRDLILFYSNKSPATAPFLDDLIGWQKEFSRLKVILTFTDTQEAYPDAEQGRIGADMVRRHLPDIATPVYYVSGPPDMSSAMVHLLGEMGVADTSIKYEVFDGY